MRSYFKSLINFVPVLALLVTSRACPANPIDVYYTASGTSGNYLLDFTVVNNMTSDPTQNIYFFGIELNNPTIQASPTGFDPNIFSKWDNSSEGGSSTVYNAVWEDVPATSFLGGTSPTSLSGFTVKVTDATLPTTVNWFAYSKSLNSVIYTGGGNFNDAVPTFNPGFQGTSNLTSVPEPSTLALLSVSGIACGVWGFRRRSSQA